jgi:hypothetical protein
MLPLLVSCAGPALHSHFRSYNTAYADSLNEQMLLNLARLENGHPPYYLIIGTINNKISLSSQTGVGTTGNFTDSRTTAQNKQVQSGVLALVSRTITRVASVVFGYSANETVTSSDSPEFQFIPLNNEAVAKQVLEPISTDVFLQLYQQGYPIDHLLRVLIERIETTMPDQNGKTVQLVLVNSPTRGKVEDYARFLRACAILRELQRSGLLTMEATNEVENLDPASLSKPSGGAVPGSSGHKGNRPDTNSEKPDTAGPADLGNDSNPTLGDIADAEEKGMRLHHDAINGSWRLERKLAVPKFFLKWDIRLQDAIDKVATNYFKSNPRAPTSDVQAIMTVVQMLHEGISIQTKVENRGGARTHLVLRSFARAMEAVASEQAGFYALCSRTNYLEGTTTSFGECVPAAEMRPILQTLWADYRDRDHPLVPNLQTIRYAGKSYSITDPDYHDPLDPRSMWNRDVFRLMVALSSQVTVDISKFQRQVLELSP